MARTWLNKNYAYGFLLDIVKWLAQRRANTPSTPRPPE